MTMIYDNAYADELTREEKNWGFELLDVKDPRESQLGRPKIKAVVYKLGPSDRIVRVATVKGNWAYRHQRYGRMGTMTTPNWLPVGDMTFVKPGLAIQMIRP